MNAKVGHLTHQQKGASNAVFNRIYSSKWRHISEAISD